jgi:hypothetical protein
MQPVTFISANPFLTLSTRELPHCIQFIKHYYSTDDPQEIELLRGREGSFIAEAGSIELEELIKLYNEVENKILCEAEEKDRARAEEKKRKKAEHDFYSTLRMTDRVGR